VSTAVNHALKVTPTRNDDAIRSVLPTQVRVIRVGGLVIARFIDNADNDTSTVNLYETRSVVRP
jgi:hypothetical protein